MAKDTGNSPDSTRHFNLEASIEAILFVSSSAVSTKHIADAIGLAPRVVEKALKSLERALKNRGIRIQKSRGGYQLTTAPEFADLVENFLNLETSSKLSQASLETLAIIAYQQPVTRPMIDSVRGVNSDSVIKSLLSKGLIEEAGRSESPGRPILYTTSPEFLQHFGLSSLKDLPALSLPEMVHPQIPMEQPELPLDPNILKE
jgi:segregation and condensation protein B